MLLKGDRSSSCIAQSWVLLQNEAPGSKGDPLATGHILLAQSQPHDEVKRQSYEGLGPWAIQALASHGGQ